MRMLRPLGRLNPTNTEHIKRYPLRVKKIVETVEKVLPLSDELVTWYDQGDAGACVGYATDIMMSILNGDKYNGKTVWNEAKKYDEIDETNPGDDNGTTVVGAMRVLAKLGNKRYTRAGTEQKNWNKKLGISEYRWASTVNDVRTMISQNTPVVFGIDWFAQFDNPIRYKKHYWIGITKHLGAYRGGHAICCIGASDKLRAFLLQNSWGLSYGDKGRVWIPYKLMQKLMNRPWAEAALVTDIV